MQRYFWAPILVGGIVFAFSISNWRVTPMSVLVSLCVLLVSWWMSPLNGGKSRTHAELSDLPDAERRVVIYWRPGCMFCQRLKGALRDEGKEAIWINIWQDDEGAAFVRSVNDGNETVPTVVIEGEAHTNPDPQTVREALASAP